MIREMVYFYFKLLTEEITYRRKEILHLFSKLRDLCSWHLKGISCVLAAVNQTSNRFFLFKKAQHDLKVPTV